MSIYATNEYIISSNNSMNDNKYNSQKAASKTHRIKSILKPLLRMLKKNNSRKRIDQDYSSDYCTECSDNSANEELESSLIDELSNCHPNSAIFVCEDDGQWNVRPVNKGQTYVPVHFARTEAGTFFWTSINKSADSDLQYTKNCFTQCQDAAEQMFTADRWVQA